MALYEVIEALAIYNIIGRVTHKICNEFLSAIPHLIETL